MVVFFLVREKRRLCVCLQAVLFFSIISIPIYAKDSASSDIFPDLWLIIMNKALEGIADPQEKIRTVGLMPLHVFRELRETNKGQHTQYILRALPLLGDTFVWSIQNGKLDWAKELLVAQYDFIDLGTQGHPALLAAARAGDAVLVRMLITITRNENTLVAANGENNQALLAAVGNGHYEVVHELLTQGPQQYRAHANARGGQALILAAEYGHVELVKLLLMEGPQEYRAHANALDSLALICAAGKGHVEVVKLLMMEGPEQCRACVDDNGGEALRLAAQYGHTEIEKLLREYQELQKGRRQ
jgi:ankyrin repeat protein